MSPACMPQAMSSWNQQWLFVDTPDNVEFYLPFLIFNSMKYAPVPSPFYEWECWATEQLNHLAKVTQTVCKGQIWIWPKNHDSAVWAFPRPTGAMKGVKHIMFLRIPRGSSMVDVVWIDLAWIQLISLYLRYINRSLSWGRVGVLKVLGLRAR